MKKCRIRGKGTKWIVETKFLWFWIAEYDLVDDEYSIVSPDLYGPLRIIKTFDDYLTASTYVRKKYPKHQFY